MFTSEKSRFGSFYLVNTTILAFSSFFKQHDFELKILLGVRFWIEKKHNASDLEVKKNASDFEKKKKQRVRFWNTICSSSQILRKNFYKVSDFKLKKFIFFNLEL